MVGAMCANHDGTVALEDAERLRAIHAALECVMDPEIPTLNVVEMGMIADVRLEPSGVVVDMTPTFVATSPPPPLGPFLQREGEEKVDHRIGIMNTN